MSDDSKQKDNLFSTWRRATFDPEAPSLGEFLGDMRWGLDLLFAQGDFVAVPGPP